MKLVFAIVHDEDTPRLMAELNKAGFRVTKLNSSGGFLRSGNTTLMIVVETEKQQEVLGMMKTNPDAVANLLKTWLGDDE